MQFELKSCKNYLKVEQTKYKRYNIEFQQFVLRKKNSYIILFGLGGIEYHRPIASIVFCHKSLDAIQQIFLAQTFHQCTRLKCLSQKNNMLDGIKIFMTKSMLATG